MIESTASNRMAHSCDWSIACEKHHVSEKEQVWKSDVKLHENSLPLCDMNYR